MWRCWFLHKWSKWAPVGIVRKYIVNEEKPVQVSIDVLRRTCERCGIIQTEDMKEVR